MSVVRGNCGIDREVKYVITGCDVQYYGGCVFYVTKQAAASIVTLTYPDRGRIFLIDRRACDVKHKATVFAESRVDFRKKEVNHRSSDAETSWQAVS